MKTMNVMLLAKMAMKYFFDIDPAITEHIIEYLLRQGSVLHKELVSTLQVAARQQSGPIWQLAHEQAYPAAA